MRPLATAIVLSLIAAGCNESPEQRQVRQISRQIATKPTRNNSPDYRDFWLICMTEGRGVINCNAINVYEGARGPAQIRKIFLTDANEWLANHGLKTYSHEDMHDPGKAFVVCQAVWRKYGFKTTEERVRSHCGGPDGPWQNCTLEYWKIAQQYL